MGCPVNRASPHATDEPFLLYSDEFANHPHGVYEQMRRQHGSLVPVELAPDVPATLVIGYRTAVRILQDPEHFPADPSTWQESVPEDCPVLPMMRKHRGPRCSTGAEHARYRRASVAALATVDLHELHYTVERLAASLINLFIESGSADLVSQYAFPLMLEVLNELIGCSADVGARVAQGMAARFDADAETSTQGMETVTAALTQHVRSKHIDRGDDLTTMLIDDPSGLDDGEVVDTAISFYAAGVEAGSNWVANALLMLLTDGDFGGELLAGSLSPEDALDLVLFDDPPIANLCTTYPRQPILIEDVWLPAHQPVVISIAACNADPAIAASNDARRGNRSHLSFSAGLHACPARTMASHIARDMIDYLLDFIPEIKLATPVEELGHRPGPFQHSLTALPVVFPADHPIRPESLSGYQRHHTKGIADMQVGQPSKTARYVARVRADHQCDEQRIFTDPLAIRIAGDREESEIDQGLGQGLVRGRKLFICARSRFAEDVIAAALAEGADQVVILAAGLDTTAVRYASRYPHVRFVEVDQRDTQEWKRRRLAEEAIPVPPGITFTAVDLESSPTPTLAAALSGAGVDDTRRTVFVALGLSMYLTKPPFDGILRYIASRPGPSELVADYFPPIASTPHDAMAVQLQQRATRVAAVHEPWVAYYSPAEITRTLQSCGYNWCDDYTGAQLVARYGLHATIDPTGPHLIYASTHQARPGRDNVRTPTAFSLS